MKRSYFLFSIFIIISFFSIISWIVYLQKTDENISEEKNSIVSATEINDDSNLFESLNEKSNLIFAYGIISAVDPVSCSDIDGSYSYVKKTTESKGFLLIKNVHVTHWKTVDEVITQAEKLNFLSWKFNYDEINLPKETLVKTEWNRAEKIRHSYYVKERSYSGTLLLQIKNKTIKIINFFPNQTIEQAKEKMIAECDNKVYTSLGYVIGIILSSGVVLLLVNEIIELVTQDSEETDTKNDFIKKREI